MKKGDQFDDFINGMSGKPSRLADAIKKPTTEISDVHISPEQRETLLRNRNLHRGRGNRVEAYKNKTFRISASADDTMTKIAAISGKPFKDLLDEAVAYLATVYGIHY